MRITYYINIFLLRCIKSIIIAINVIVLIVVFHCINDDFVVFFNFFNICNVEPIRLIIITIINNFNIDVNCSFKQYNNLNIFIVFDDDFVNEY